MGRLLKALTEDVAALVRLWLRDHIVAPPSAEHGVVALALTATIAGSFCWLLFLLACGRSRAWRGPRAAWGGANRRPVPPPCPPLNVPKSPKRMSEAGATLRRRTLRRHRIPERHEPYLQKYLRSGGYSGTSYIDMQGQRLTKCPEQLGFAGYSIVVVNLAHNALETIPESFVCLRGLRELRLDFNRLRDLPGELASLPALEVLSLAHNAFSCYPACIAGIPSLKALDLSHNRLSCLLPERRSRGSFVSLELLRLAFNRLLFLPDPMARLPSLLELDLSHNRLHCLPHDWTGLASLERLDLSRNCLHSVSPRLHLCSSLTMLLLGNNRLRQLPSSLFSLFGLLVLDISHNQLRFLPKAVLNIRCVTELRAAGNPWLDHDLGPSAWALEIERLISPEDHHDARRARCCRSQWLEMTKSPPQLLETAAAVIVEQAQWSDTSLPASLHEFLLSVDRCVFCSAAVFPPRCCRSIGFFKDTNVWLPYSDVTCPTLDAL